AWWNSDNSTAPVISVGLLAGANNGSGIPTPTPSAASSTDASSTDASSTDASSSAASSSSASAGNRGNTGGPAQANKNAAFVLRAPALTIAGSAFGLLFGLIAA
ncbi:hypothetical protein EWM64_g9747, partial [Hericium alpestre]